MRFIMKLGKMKVSLADVIDPATLADIYREWLKDYGKSSREGFAEWSQRLFRAGFGLDITVSAPDNNFVLTVEPPFDKDATFRKEISFSCMRNDFYQAVRNSLERFNDEIAKAVWSRTLRVPETPSEYMLNMGFLGIKPVIRFVLPRWSEVYQTDELDTDGANLRNDLNFWTKLQETDTQVLIAPSDLIQSVFSEFPEEILTGTWYHSPLVFCAVDDGYWVDKNTKLGRFFCR